MLAPPSMPARLFATVAFLLAAAVVTARPLGVAGRAVAAAPPTTAAAHPSAGRTRGRRRRRGRPAFRRTGSEPSSPLRRRCSFVGPTARAAAATAPPKMKCRSFDEMLETHRHAPLLIDFYAPWCGPCKMMKGELSSIRSQLDRLGPTTTLPIAGEDESTDEGEDEVTSGSGAMTRSIGRPSGIPVYHVNTNKFPQVGARNKVHGLPTLVLFYEGKEIWRNEGILLGPDIVKALRGLQEAGCWEMTTEEARGVRVGED